MRNVNKEQPKEEKKVDKGFILTMRNVNMKNQFKRLGVVEVLS